MAWHTIPAAGGGGALVEGDVLVQFGNAEATSSTGGDFTIGDGGTFADPAGWYDANEEAIILPAGLYQLDVGATFGGQLADAWRLAMTIAGDTVQREIVTPAALFFDAWRCATSQVVHLPEPCYIGFMWARAGISATAVTLSLRIAELV